MKLVTAIIKPFKLERYYTIHEFTAKYLLCSSDCEAMTFHSLGLSAIKKQNRACKVEGKKNYKIINSLLGQKYKSAPALNKLISLLKSSMADWEDIHAINHIIDKYNIEFDGLIDEQEAIEKGLDSSLVNVEDSKLAFEQIKGQTISFVLGFELKVKPELVNNN